MCVHGEKVWKPVVFVVLKIRNEKSDTQIIKILILSINFTCFKNYYIKHFLTLLGFP